MMKFLTPIILIGLSIAVFLIAANPFFKEIGELKIQAASYDGALTNAESLEKERDRLTAKSNAIDKGDIEKLQKFLPENVDNIRLILEIEKIAVPYGMILKDIKYNVTDKKADSQNGVVSTIQGGGVVAPVVKDYGVWDLEFSTNGTYNNFLNFTKDLESNLRVVDIDSIKFSSNVNSAISGVPVSPATESYKYDFKIKTYWLKN